MNRAKPHELGQFLGDHQARAAQVLPAGSAQRLPCGCQWRATAQDKHGPVFWNEYNGVVQCHKCGQVYTPRTPGAPA